MIQIKITGRKTFTNALFLQETFDSFVLGEAVFQTFQTFHMDGKVCKDYFSDEEEIPSCVLWKLARPLCFQLIKGKRLPNYFKIVLCANEDLIKQLTETLPLRPEEVGGLYLNIRYQENQMLCTSGTSMKGFSMDRELPKLWDEYVKQFFLQQDIPFDFLM